LEVQWTCDVQVKLDVSNNGLSALPEALGGLKKILRINASNNSLTRVPHALGVLPLKELDLR